jgi:hypothetical protein
LGRRLIGNWIFRGDRIREGFSPVGNMRSALHGLGHGGYSARPDELKRRVSADGVSAVHADGFAGHELGGAGRQIDGGTRDFLGLSPSTRRGAGHDLIVHRFEIRRAHRRGHVGLDPTGSDRVDLDVMWGEFDCHRLGELDDRAFRRTVRCDESGAEIGIHAAKVDDLAALAGNHRGGGDFREE